MLSHTLRSSLRAGLGLNKCLRPTNFASNRFLSEAAKEESGNSDVAGEHPQNEQLKTLEDENKKLLDQVKDLDDKFKRALAEAENTRLRMKKQIDDTKIYAIQGFCKDLLEVADIFGSAIESVNKDNIGSNTEFKNLFDGVMMTEQQLQTIFRRHGLVQLNPIGEKFNPNEQHALFEIPAPDKEPGLVGIVQKIGYKLHDRTIRPAMVGVTKK